MLGPCSRSRLLIGDHPITSKSSPTIQPAAIGRTNIFTGRVGVFLLCTYKQGGCPSNWGGPLWPSISRGPYNSPSGVFKSSPCRWKKRVAENSIIRQDGAGAPQRDFASGTPPGIRETNREPSAKKRDDLFEPRPPSNVQNMDTSIFSMRELVFGRVEYQFRQRARTMCLWNLFSFATLGGRGASL